MVDFFKPILKRKITSAFDAWSNTYSKEVAPKLDRRGYGYTKLAKLILDALNPSKGAQILEIGVGSGILGREIAKKNPSLNMLGCDISRGMLMQASKTDKYQFLFECDAEGKIPMSAKSITYVYSAFMAHSAINMKLFFSELRRILAENQSSLVIVDLFRTKKRLPIISKLVDNLHSWKYEYGAFSNYYTIDEFLFLAKKAGFEVGAYSTLDVDNTITQKSAGKMSHYIIRLVPVC